MAHRSDRPGAVRIDNAGEVVGMGDPRLRGSAKDVALAAPIVGGAAVRRRRSIRALFGAVSLFVAVLGPTTSSVRSADAASGSPSVSSLLFSGDGHGVEAIDSDGTNRRELVDGAHADQTADGRRLVYTRYSQRYDEGGIQHTTATLYTANGDGTNQRPLGDGSITGDYPRWSPDATRIAFDLRPRETTLYDSSPPRIAVVGADGRGLEVLGVGEHPDWSPDGNEVVFGAANRLWVVPAHAGSRATAITPPADFAVEGPRWSPDGTVIAFGGACVGLVHPDGSGFRCKDGLSGGGYQVGGWDPTSRELTTSWGGFHHWTSMQWTDPATGQARSVGSTAIPSAWAKPTGPVPCSQGYWLLGRDGGVFSFGTAAFHGSTGGMRLNRPVVGMAATATGAGYWLVAGDGGIFSFGDAPFFGSTDALRLRAPVVGMTATPTGQGYLLVASDGGIFTFGDAAFFGSTGALRLRAPVVGMAATPTGQGYWLVASDGGIFTFGDAAFFGSTGGQALSAPIVGMTRSSTGLGYTLVGRDGATFVFGDARAPGDATTPGLPNPVSATTGTSGDGVLLATTAGEVVALQAARFCGSARNLALAAPIVGAAASPR
jgi:hypothetical protein